MSRRPRTRLAIALLLPSALGAVGLFVWRSLPATFWLYLGIGCAAAPWWLLRARPLTGRGGVPLIRRRERPPWPRAWLWLAVVFGPVFLAVYLRIRPGLDSIDAYRDRLAALGLPLDAPLAAATAFLLLNPLLEEWWWRGQATPRCVAAFGRGRGLAVAAAAFGVYHVVLLAGLFPLSVAILRAVFIALAGLLWSWVAWRQGRWLDVYAAHLAADVAMVVLFMALVL